MFAYKKGDVHKVSDPSIPEAVHVALQASLDCSFAVNYSRLVGSGPGVDDLLDPPDSYPFFEYSDFEFKDRALILGCRVGEAMDRMPEGYIVPLAQNALIAALDVIAQVESEDGWAATVLAAAALEDAVKESAKAKALIDTGPKPARPGHLMAEGRSYGVAKEAIKDGNRYGRKVTFNEPVNAFTMLHRDDLARGGDMLTAVTISDTEEHQVKDYRGNMKSAYSARAVNI